MFREALVTTKRQPSGCQSQPSPNASAIKAVAAALRGDMDEVSRICREDSAMATQAALRQFPSTLHVTSDDAAPCTHCNGAGFVCGGCDEWPCAGDGHYCERGGSMACRCSDHTDTDDSGSVHNPA
jgi:hypothetical protein